MINLKEPKNIACTAVIKNISLNLISLNSMTWVKFNEKIKREVNWCIRSSFFYNISKTIHIFIYIYRKIKTLKLLLKINVSGQAPLSRFLLNIYIYI